MKALKIGSNQKGIRYAIVKDGSAFSVYKECANYASHVPGSIAYTWRYVERNMPLEQAEKLFAKRVAGKR
jgi:hypothetical protein